MGVHSIATESFQIDIEQSDRLTMAHRMRQFVRGIVTIATRGKTGPTEEVDRHRIAMDMRKLALHKRRKPVSMSCYHKEMQHCKPTVKILLVIQSAHWINVG